MSKKDYHNTKFIILGRTFDLLSSLSFESNGTNVEMKLSLWDIQCCLLSPLEIIVNVTI